VSVTVCPPSIVDTVPPIAAAIGWDAEAVVGGVGDGLGGLGEAPGLDEDGVGLGGVGVTPPLGEVGVGLGGVGVTPGLGEGCVTLGIEPELPDPAPPPPHPASTIAAAIKITALRRKAFLDSEERIGRREARKA
jgi:hypothetical protein